MPVSRAQFSAAYCCVKTNKFLSHWNKTLSASNMYENLAKFGRAIFEICKRTDSYTYMHTYIHTYIQTYRQTDRHGDRNTLHTYRRRSTQRDTIRPLAFSTYSAQTVRPSPKLTHERHFLGISTSPRHDSHCPKLCCLSCTPITNTPWKYPILVAFGMCKTPEHKFWIFFNGLCMRTPIHVFISKMLIIGAW